MTTKIPPQMTPEPKPLRILRLPEVRHKVGLGKSRIYELMAAGRFPKALKLTDTASGWLEHEIDAFILERAAARDSSGESGAEPGAAA